MASQSQSLLRQTSKSPDPESDAVTERLIPDAKIEQEVPIQKATVIPKTLFFAEFIIYLGLLLMIIVIIVFYSELWGLPQDDITSFRYPIVPLTAVYLTGIIIFSLGSIYRLIFLESNQKAVWWIGFVGCLCTFTCPALVIVGDHIFVDPFVHQKLKITGGHKAIYALTILSVLILCPCVMALDMFGKQMKRARFHKLLIGMGILMFQISTIVTIHSFIVHVGFGLCLFGIVLFFAGVIVGRIESRRKEAQQVQETVLN